MKVKKIKFEQYRVRGKHRDFEVLVFPRRRYLWAYHDNDDDVYAIDGDPAGYELVKYALATLIADPNKIIYFPIRDNKLDSIFSKRYDAVLTRTELQFRRSEWIKLRRQLNKAHRIENFVLRYDPDRLLAYAKRYEKDSESWKVWQKEKQEVSALWGDTLFITLLKGTCFMSLPKIFEVVQNHDVDCYPAWQYGWYLTNGWIKYLQEWNKKQESAGKECVE